MIKNNRALSTIIASLILILLSLTAVSIIWITIKGLTNSVALSPELNCFDIKIQPPITINSVCYNSENKQIEIELKRDFNELQINSISIFSDSNSEWQCSSTCGNCIIPNSGETKTYFLKEETQPKEIIFQVENCIIETKNVRDC
ncbi:MAG: hypothetical protein WC584_03555 [Candidatus Pacearchaeota archaeon]